MHTHQPKPILKESDIALLPKLYATENDKTPLYRVHLFNYFNPLQFWLISEYCPDQRISFGYVDLGYGGENGYISIEELESISNLSCFIEINRSWVPNTLSESLKQVVEHNRKFGVKKI